MIRDCDDAFPNPVAERSIYLKLLDKIAENGNCVYAYHKAEDALGYCAFYANDPEQGNAFISLLAVRQEYQHMHIGADLLKSAFERMVSCGMEHCFLEVRKDNEAAKCFYEKMGFEKAEEHGDKYLMRRDLANTDWNRKFVGGNSTPSEVVPTRTACELCRGSSVTESATIQEKKEDVS